MKKQKPRDGQQKTTPGRNREFINNLTLLSTVNVLPAQFFAEARASTSGEKRLLLAVLERAISDLCNTRSSQSSVRDREEARQWVESREESSPYSFIRICEALGLDPDALRQGILALEREELLSPDVEKQRAVRWRRRAHVRRESQEKIDT
jgi:hypothetical protein